MLPYGRQQISEDDIQAVVSVLQSEYLTQGPAVPAFERRLSELCGGAHAVAVNSATSALHLACLAIGVGPGDVVWTSPISFVASANCALYCGADVEFVDIDPRTYCLSVETLAAKLEDAARRNRLPKALILVHLCGQPCQLAEVAALSREYGFRVIEDAAHALGARYQGQPVGDGRYSDITVFSFHPVKIITTGEGGAAVTNQPELAARMRRLRSHGVTRDRAEMTAEPEGSWQYEQIELGFNYRLTDLQAALGQSQLRQLDAFVERRRALAARYDQALAGLPVTCPWQHPDTASAFHLYVIRLQLDRLKRSRREIFDRLRAAAIGVNVHYIPIYRQPFYARLGKDHADCPEAERYYAEAITLPLFPGMTDQQQDQVVKAIRGCVA